MPRPRSRSRSAAALALALAAIAYPSWARAQACCAGGTALTPGRLNLHESELAAISLHVTGITGSFDQNGRFLASPKGATEVDLEQDVIGTVRVLESGQISLIAPVVQTMRRVPGASEWGGGVGDLQIALRWDATLAGVSLKIPGVAVLAGLTLPSGVPPEHASRPLATDATGTGAIQGALGLSLEQMFGNVLVSLTGTAALRSARMVEGIHTQLGPAFTATGALGYAFDAGPVAALTLSYTGQLATRNDGVPSPEGGRAGLRIGISGGYAWSDWWRVQGGVFGDPPLPHAGQNQPAGAGAQVTLLRSW